MQPLDSASIAATHHDPKTNTLTVRFRTGAAYRLSNVTAEQHAALRAADSPGAYYATEFRGNAKHPAVKVGQ